MKSGIPLTALLIAALARPASAGPGHDHAEATPAASSSSRPRFAAHSDQFELVGIAEGTTLVLYLDSFASNTPISVAELELELQPAGGAARKLKATSGEDGTFKIDLGNPLADGVTAVTASIRVQADGKPVQDLLAGSIDVPRRPDEDTVHGTDVSAQLLGAVGAALALFIGWFMWFRNRARHAPGFWG